MGQLKEAVEKRKNFIIQRLIRTGFTKMEDGRQLYELPLSDLEHLYIYPRCQRAKFVEIERVIG